MIELKGTPKEKQVRQWFNEKFDGTIPATAKVIDLFRRFEVEVPGISYGCLNSTMKKVKEEGHTSSPSTSDSVVAAPKEVITPKIMNIEDMEFPNFKLFQSKKLIDTIMSDHEEDGGVYGGTVNIVVGESGTGKSTILLDMLAAIQENHPDSKMLYISSEMTRNDILFYYQKTPSIARVPTLLMMDYVKSGQLDTVLAQTFNDNYDIIVLDSYQDVVVKLKEVQQWKSTFAESWLTNMMIDAAEINGTAVFAIQHMTKGGQYVGSTYLKHATTAMLELRFDEAGLRYMEFSKNRRGGSMTGKRLYFSLVKGDIVYDENRFVETNELKEIESTEAIRQVDLSRKFEDIFINGNGVNEESTEESDSVVDEVVEVEEQPGPGEE